MQGLFLQYRDHPEKVVECAREELVDASERIKEMNIYEWLRRLNMQQYSPKFRKDSIHFVSDLKYLVEAELTGYGITLMTSRKRIMSMLTGDPETKSMFAMLNYMSAMQIVSKFYHE